MKVMTANTFTTLGVLLIGLGPAMAQTTAPKFVLGAVDGFKVESTEIRVKPDKGETVSLKLRGDTQVLRVPAGETDLKKAEPIKITDVASGDRVLVTLMPGVFEARRIVVMSSSDIAKRNEADRLDWSRRGVLGIVTAKSGGEITLKMRTMGADKKGTVTVSDGTGFRRYAPDSVKFADARKSSLAEVSVGDQLRARGQKSDGLKVTAEEVVFGTFVTKAGPITAVNVEAKEITVKDLASGKPLVIQVSGDSQVKKLPNFAAMFAGGGPPGGGAPGGPGGSGGPTGGVMRGPGGGAPDLSQMLERMPSAKLEDLTVGETIVASSTKGTSDGRITAIMLVANADMLIKMASVQLGSGGRPGGGAGAGAAMGGMGSMMGGMGGGGVGGLDLGGMAP
jgi:hypothetical protein